VLAAAAPTAIPAASVHLPLEPETRPSPDNGGQDLQDEIKSLERARIMTALERCGGNQSKAAEALGISRRTLVSRLSEFGLPRPRKSS
jgi:DNA-binding NtrC family response regulator